MKRSSISMLAIVLGLTGACASAREDAEPVGAREQRATAAPGAAAQPAAKGQAAAPAPAVPAPDRAALEAEFTKLLTGAKLVGSFTLDSAPDQPPQKDSYTIQKAEKLQGDQWRIEAVMEYAGKRFAVPILIDVLWAGKTPVMTLDELAIPMVGTYSARVLFHGTNYAGYWSGSNYGGHLFGRVERAEPAVEAASDK